MKKLLVMGVAGVLAGGVSFVTFAQRSATKEISTAHAHALMAQGSTTVAEAHTHLHHVINCLVGPGGDGFDAAAGTPCKGQGDGALKDAASDAALQAKLQGALGDARNGLKSSSLGTVQQDAAKAAAALGDTPSQKPRGGYSW